jgi:hypothetical protein
MNQPVGTDKPSEFLVAVMEGLPFTAKQEAEEHADLAKSIAHTRGLVNASRAGGGDADWSVYKERQAYLKKLQW